MLAGVAACGLATAGASAKAQTGKSRSEAAASSTEYSFELSELSVTDLQQGLQSGKYTSKSLVEKYLARIEAVDDGGPTLGSIIELNPDATSIAEQLDAERKSKGARGPLHGIPVLIKDNVDTADKMATTAGSLALVGAKPPDDAFVAKQLRQAGAVLLGKTNLSEWSNIRSRNSTSGWSGRGGLTRNPYAIDRNPCGSSSGSAAAVAASLCAVAVGTETDGSILCPASVCGIVGIKPTVGLLSRTGIIPISQSQDTAGPLARTVRDAAILLGALAGVDPQDAVTSDSRGQAHADYTKFLDAAGLKDKKIGVARNFFDFHEGVERLIAEALDALKQGGATLIDSERLSKVDEAGSAESTEEKGPLTEYEYVEALARCRRLARTEGIDAVMDEHRLDAIVAPTIGPACMTDLVNGDHWLGGSTSPAAIAGYPSITVPAGFVAGLPVGISFIGRAWSEPALVKIAYAFEQATKRRLPPKFPPTI
jgi:amidase